MYYIYIYNKNYTEPHKCICEYSFLAINLFSETALKLFSF